MGAGLSTGRLFDRRDADHAFKSLDYFLNTEVKSNDENGVDCIVDVDAVSSYIETSRIVAAFESVLDEMVQDATTGFLHRAPRTGVVRSSTSSSTLAPNTPNARRTVLSAESTGAVVTPERGTYNDESRHLPSQAMLAFDRSGSPAHLRRLLIEDALQLKGGDKLVYVMKGDDIGAGLMAKFGIEKSILAEEAGFFRGCCKYVQVPCIVKSNPKGAQYIQDLGELGTKDLIDFVSKGEGLTLQPYLYSSSAMVGWSFQVKFREMLALPNSECAIYELWDSQGGVNSRYRDYNNLLSYKALPGNLISSNPSKYKRIQYRSEGDAAKLYPVVNQLRKEVHGDPMATMEVALSAMDKISALRKHQAKRQKQAKKKKDNEREAKKKKLKDGLREELNSLSKEWATKKDAAIFEKLQIYYEKPYDRCDLVLLDVDEEIDAIKDELPELWKTSSVIATDFTLERINNRTKKEPHRLLWCMSTLRSRNPQLLVDYATVLRLGLMAMGKGKGLLRRLTMGLIVSDTTIHDFMNANFEKFNQLHIRVHVGL